MNSISTLTVHLDASEQEGAQEDYTVVRGGISHSFEKHKGIFIPQDDDLTVQDLLGLGFGCVGVMGDEKSLLYCTLGLGEHGLFQVRARAMHQRLVSVEENRNPSSVAALTAAFEAARR